MMIVDCCTTFIRSGLKQSDGNDPAFLKRSINKKMLWRWVSIIFILLFSIQMKVDAQPVTTNVFPLKNQNNVSPSIIISATFSEPVGISYTTSYSRPFFVRGTMSGSADGIVSGTNTMALTYNPSYTFFPGEKVEVGLVTGAIHSGGVNLATPYVWNFLTATQAASAVYSTSSAVGTINDSSSVVFADFDSNGFLDIVVSSENKHAVYLNDSNGHYPLSSEISFGANSTSTQLAAVADFNGDGRQDIALGNDGDVNRVYFNSGPVNLNFNTSVSFGTSDYTASLIAGDMDGDGDFDLVSMSNYDIRIYLNAGSGSFPTSKHIVLGSILSLTIGDVDGDADLDIAVGNRYGQNVVFLNDGKGNFGTSKNFGTGMDPTLSVAFGDVDNDEDLDVAVGNQYAQNAVYLNDGSGNFTAGTRNFGTGSDNTTQVVFGDVNGDGYLDIVCGNYYQKNVVYLNDGSGHFSSDYKNFGSGTERISSVALGDVDGDGDLDIAIGERFNKATVFYNEDRVVTLTRGFSNNSYCPNYYTVVSVTAEVEGAATQVQSLAVVETVPDEFIPVNISHDGFYNPITKDIRWFLMTDLDLVTVLSYELLPPSSATGCYTFNGMGTYLTTNGTIEEATVMITGATNVCKNCTVQCCQAVDGGCSLAPGNCDKIIETYELLYSADELWKKGAVCPTTSELLQAAGFWKRGGGYDCTVNGDYVPVNVSGKVIRDRTVSLSSSGDFVGMTSLRDLPDPLIPGETVTVHIDLIPINAPESVAIEEVVPEGWTVTHISHDGNYIQETHTIRWFLLSNFEARLSYDITVGDGVGLFDGKVSYIQNFNEGSTVIEGDGSIPTSVRGWKKY